MAELEEKQETLEETDWVKELETALQSCCDFGTVRNITKCKAIPNRLRAQVWQICLNVLDKNDMFSGWEEVYDLPEQSLIRDDCQELVAQLENEETEKCAIQCDIESIITLFCKSENVHYSKDCGWLGIIQVLLSLKFQRTELYNCFFSMMNRYVPRDCQVNGKPFHLFRLLLLYHDPQLCSFLDTKKISPDQYAIHWFRNLFATSCNLEVIQKMWDVYLQHADPFLMFFLALVIVINAKEEVMKMEQESKEAIIKYFESMPGQLEPDDIEDFCSLAQYYASRTPQSFRKEFQGPLFDVHKPGAKEADASNVSQMLCLPVSVRELLHANQLGSGEGVRYFVVDCRPAEQYNSGHLVTAFHLDSNLLLENPGEFALAVEALFAAQKRAILAGSSAGGEHLCFMGSGHEQEDQYLHMVVANFLQRKCQYVSQAEGGHEALIAALQDDLVGSISEYIVGGGSEKKHNQLETSGEMAPSKSGSFFGRFSTVFKTKSMEMKDKLKDYIANTDHTENRHLSGKSGHRYRNQVSVFSIDDGSSDDGSSVLPGDEELEKVSLDVWLKKPEVKHQFPCQFVQDRNNHLPSHLLLTDSHLYILREAGSGMAFIQSRRSLGSVVRITSKRKQPELITFQYGTSEKNSLTKENEVQVTDTDRLFIPKAGDAVKVVKLQIMRVLDALDEQQQG